MQHRTLKTCPTWNVEATFKPCRSGDLDVMGMPDHRPARDLRSPSTTGSMPTPAGASCAQNSQICMGFALIGDKLKLAQNGGSVRVSVVGQVCHVGLALGGVGLLGRVGEIVPGWARLALGGVPGTGLGPVLARPLLQRGVAGDRAVVRPGT